MFKAYYQAKIKAITGVFSYFSLYSLRKKEWHVLHRVFRFRILAVCLNSCAYSENRKHYWNCIYTWAVGGSHHLNDSNFQTIWINVTNTVFSFGIGCFQQLAHAASQCAIVDCAQAPTLILFFSLHIGGNGFSRTATSCPALRRSKFVSSASKQVVGSGGKDH